MEKTTDITEYTGSLCEVFTMENMLLFAGILKECREEDTARLVHYKGLDLPRGIPEGSSVKLRVNMAGDRGHILIYRGSVLRAYSTYWDIRLLESLSSTEQRKNFRQYVDVWASLIHSQSASDCHIIDVSLTGAGLKCKEFFAPGEQLALSRLKLTSQGPVYELKITVRRILPPDGDGMYFYGCSFDSPDERTQELLYRDIMKLQAEDLKRRNT